MILHDRWLDEVEVKEKDCVEVNIITSRCINTRKYKLILLHISLKYYCIVVRMCKFSVNNHSNELF